MECECAIYKAKETEYKGVVFRSKSEALLARSFDLIGGLWEYEPSQYCTKDNDTWTPDFRLVLKIDHYLYEYVVEYKPSVPTKTYVTRLLNNYRSYYLRHDWTAPSLLLICGSFFDEKKERFIYESMPGDTDLGYFMHERLFFSSWNKANDYRFDLANGGI